MYDILIKNGLIVDGTGKEAFRSDIGIKEGRIANIGSRLDTKASKTIDAAGLIVAPGFIDVHSHNDLVPFMDPKLQGLKLMQGVTTELVGQCGLGVAPCVDSEDSLWKNYVRGVVGDHGSPWCFHDFSAYLSQLENIRLRNNYTALISHGAVRAKVMGFDKAVPDDAQLEQMCRIVEAAMVSGAFGMSLGLQYMPAIFSQREELVALCRVVKEYNGIVMVHLRNHDRTIINALKEIIDIARESGVRLHISHLRSYNSADLGCSAPKLILSVEEAVNQGLSVTFDEHLYLSGSTLMTQLLPPWASIDRLTDPEMREKVKLEIQDRSLHYPGWDNYSAVTGWDGILITSVKREENLKYIGRTVGEIARECDMEPVEAAIDILISEKGGVGIVTMDVFSEEDTVQLIRHPLQMVGSDSIPAGVPHPRLYGNYPLYIGKYVREKQYLSLEAAIHKATLLPAQTLGIKDVGVLQEGMRADVVVFDFETMKGYEDYRNPTRKPEGVQHVVVDGRAAVCNGQLTDVYCGRVLRHNA